MNMSYDPRFGCTHKLAMPWDKGGNTIIWDIHINQPGKYKVISQQAFAPGLEGGRYKISVNNQRLQAKPFVTQHGRDFSDLEIGVLHFPQSGDYEIRLMMLDGVREITGVDKDRSGYPREFSIQSIKLHLNE